MIDSEWDLTPQQYEFIHSRRNDIRLAIDNDDMQYLRGLPELPKFNELFGDMGIDEAWDRYEEMEMQG